MKKLKALLLSVSLLASSSFAYAEDAQPKLNVTVTKVTENTIELSYYVSDCPSSYIYWFEFFVDGLSEGLGRWDSDSCTIEYEDENARVRLQPGKKYTIRAEAQDGYQQPICSWTQEITTAEGTYNVFYDNSESKWNSISLYAWKNDGGQEGEKNANWPGVQISQLTEGSNIWTGKVSKDFPKIIFNNNNNQGEQTADLKGEHCKTYNTNSGSNLVWIPGAHNGWSTTVDYATDEVKDNLATIIVPNYNGEEFKVKVNDTWYGKGGDNPTLGQWYSNVSTAGGNFTLAATGAIKFTVSFSDGHFLAEELDPTVTNIEWVGLTQDEEGNSELNLYTDKANAPIMAYACNAAGDRLPYDITFAISEEEPNGLGSMFVNTDKVVDGRGLVIPEGAEGNKYEYTLSAVVNYPTTLSLPKQHRAAPAISNKDVKVNFNNQKTPTAIETISIDNTSDTADGVASDGPIRWYNLSGLEIPAPTAGSVCIKVQGSKAEKIFIR